MEEKPKFELTKTYVVDFTSASGRRYQGTFVFKRPTIAERSRIGVIKAQYSQGLNVDQYTDLLHTAMATLDVVCVQKPEWFDYDKLYDDDIIFHIFVEYKKWEAFFRPTATQDKGGSIKATDSTGTQSDGVGHTPSAEKVVL